VPLLLVEDSPRLARSLVKGLEEEGLSTVHVGTAQAAIDALDRQPFDAVVLDLGLPDRDGMDVLFAIRGRASAIPVLVLTARDAVASRVAALNRGADDYLLKPFAFAELVARLAALTRRAAAPRWSPLGIPGLELVTGEMLALVCGERVALSPRERALLETLLRRCGEVVTREEILRDVFGYAHDPGTNVVDVHVAHLRKKVAGAPVALQTVRTVGYRLTRLDVAEASAGAPV
jgi:DNA-binding response OmpR family regulator